MQCGRGDAARREALVWLVVATIASAPDARCNVSMPRVEGGCRAEGMAVPATRWRKSGGGRGR